MFDLEFILSTLSLKHQLLITKFFLERLRYMDVLCIDSTRVKLRDRTDDNDYIHANWVILPSKRKYICAQGPLEETVEDFWLMVYKV